MHFYSKKHYFYIFVEIILLISTNLIGNNKYIILASLNYIIIKIFYIELKRKFNILFKSKEIKKIESHFESLLKMTYNFEKLMSEFGEVKDTSASETFISEKKEALEKIELDCSKDVLIGEINIILLVIIAVFLVANLI